MIQRKQSIFLLLIAILMSLAQLLPVAYYEDFKLSITSAVNGTAGFVMETYLLVRILSLVILATSLSTIFLFKNRKLQIKLCNLLLLFEIGLIVALGMQIKDFMSFIPDLKGFPHLGFSSYFPVLSLVLTIMGQNAIKKDEELVRSVDRLR